ncbi:hypothetical protein EVG20_g10736 [Dentipellis fragilis]|uniref:Uncharacterized protein n=1 Tax=Dentipellis fragilis TaxID=205917 RepID=A0A4Y9XPK8_9AGAM|nr:hypothetical protein EVG20_g10736 [Dentipellis fragilis]
MKRAREDAYGAPPPSFYEAPPGLGKEGPPGTRRGTPPPPPPPAGEYHGVPSGRYYESGDAYREAYAAYGRPVGR